jgi:hypothetical protein
MASALFNSSLIADFLRSILRSGCGKKLILSTYRIIGIGIGMWMLNGFSVKKTSRAMIGHHAAGCLPVPFARRQVKAVALSASGPAYLW